MSERDLLARAAQLAHTHREGLRDRPAGPTASVDDVLERLAVPLGDAGVEPATAIGELADGVAGGLAANGPRWFGFVDGGAQPAALAADWLTSAWDQNAGLTAASPAATAAEEVVAGWLRELLGLPAGASFGFVTGAQMANFTGLAAARGALLRRAGWDVGRDGLWGAPRINVVLGAETHVTIHAALRMLGMGTAAAHVVAADDQGRMRPDALHATLERCDGPTLVCALAGNVHTGAFDPFEAMADLTDEHGECWLHVDGAFGLWATVAPARRHLAAGVERADSWTVDAHKWLNVPYDSGVTIVRDPSAHEAAMSLRASYLMGVPRSNHPNRTDYTPEASRRGRGFVLYATLRALGRDGVGELIERCCGHAERFADLLRAEAGIDVLNDVVLNQVLVRFPAASPDATDRRTAAVIERIQRDGTCWLAATTWRERTAMRISVVNYATTADDVERSAAAIIEAARAEGGT